jgi:Cellulase (glycosyl hydrolase family 5)
MSTDRNDSACADDRLSDRAQHAGSHLAQYALEDGNCSWRQSQKAVRDRGEQYEENGILPSIQLNLCHNQEQSSHHHKHGRHHGGAHSHGEGPEAQGDQSLPVFQPGMGGVDNTSVAKSPVIEPPVVTGQTVPLDTLPEVAPAQGAVSQQSLAAAPVSAHDAGRAGFTTQGDQIFYGGQPFVAKGFAMYSQDAPIYADQAIAKYHPNIIRLEEPTYNSYYGQIQSIQQIEQTINAITSKGVAVEVQAMDGMYGAGDNTVSGAQLQQLTQWYRTIAADERNNPLVIFASPNESQASSQAQYDSNNLAIDRAIREVSPNALIFQEAAQFQSADWVSNNLAAYRALGNTAIDYHVYQNGMQGVSQVLSDVQPYQTEGFPVVIGEFGNYNAPPSGGNPDTSAAVTNVIQANQQYGLGAIAEGWFSWPGGVGSSGSSLGGNNGMETVQQADSQPITQTAYGAEIQKWLTGA